MTLRIDRSGATFSGSPRDLERLRIQFEEQQYVRFPGVFEPELLSSIQHMIEAGEFFDNVHEDLDSSRDLCLKENRASSLLFFMLNRQTVFEIIRAVTQCGRIGCFAGRVYRLVPGCGHAVDWHSDIDSAEQRLVAMSINLSTEVYEGGTLQLRDGESGTILNEVENVGFGDAIIFSLAPRLQHRITEVKGRVPKTAFAGWFRGQPDFISLFKDYANRREAGQDMDSGSLMN